MEVNGQLHVPAALPSGKETLVPLDRRLGGPQRRSGLGGEEKNSQLLPGLEPPIIQSVAQRYNIELFRLQQQPITYVHDSCDISQKKKKTNFILTEWNASIMNDKGYEKKPNEQ
jgi:hypothetical protein